MGDRSDLVLGGVGLTAIELLGLRAGAVTVLLSVLVLDTRRALHGGTGAHALGPTGMVPRTRPVLPGRPDHRDGVRPPRPGRRATHGGDGTSSGRRRRCGSRGWSPSPPDSSSDRGWIPHGDSISRRHCASSRYLGRRLRRTGSARWPRVTSEQPRRCYAFVAPSGAAVLAADRRGYRGGRIDEPEQTMTAPRDPDRGGRARLRAPQLHGARAPRARTLPACLVHGTRGSDTRRARGHHRGTARDAPGPRGRTHRVPPRSSPPRSSPASRTESRS